ncbi:hypothetical protein [Tessaracoccus sp. ZS01]|uniref:hypothetical protein n=1 Tax=Tessaracoccus sp. ZS01 TaxID=1906324 RepID=UPI00096DA169|nr:hypothetical protein [Tessaracoccus sp. ZS01]MCG6567639.1 hypothetical protein [Tessaracoccus sp. ZS01]OMG55714.1 hypothetical protein BJN44_08395 [Tessaracoccus sp. ZS01]
MTDDDRSRIDDHLQRGMEAELASTREELTKAAAHAARMEGELFAVAQRLTAKEAEHEAALKALAKMRDELFEARSKVEEAEGEIVELKNRLAASPASPKPNLAERAVRKVVRTVKR